MESRQHEIVEGTYTKNSSLFKIRCKIHGQEFEREAGLYKRAKLGLRYGSGAKQSLSAPIGCAASSAKRALKRHLLADEARPKNHFRVENVNP